MENRRFHHLHDVGAVQRRAAVARVRCGKADLVVHDDVYRAPGAVTARLRKVQGLHHHTLASEGGVAMD